MSQTDTPSLICLNPLNFKFLSCPVYRKRKMFWAEMSRKRKMFPDCLMESEKPGHIYR
jgi:hypothetical protein